MINVLAEILEHKREEVERARRVVSIAELKARPGYVLPPRNFFGAVAVPRGGRPNLIAEIKRASPSAGLIRADFDPVAIACEYERAGAQALSVLTDEKYFGGRLDFIAQVKDAVGLPVLRKDFVIDPYQVYESRAAGADAILLIAEALEPPTLLELFTLARAEGLWVLVEVHDRERLLMVFQTLQDRLRDGLLLGLNSRDLRAQRVDLATAEDLARLVPPGLPMVAESGIRTRRDVERMHGAGARALLVGETLLRSGDVERTVRELFG